MTSKTTLSLFFLICLSVGFSITLSAQSPVLGTYPNTTVVSGENVFITPFSAPIDADQTHAQAGLNFSGAINADPTTGVVEVINAGIDGVYSISVTASNSFGTDSKTFTLTVEDPACSQGKFTPATIFPVGGPSNEHFGMAVDDFNADGHQDIAVLDRWDIFTDPESYIVTIMEGDGAGGFTEGSITAIASSPNEIVAADFNGDGAADLAITHEAVSIYLNDGSGAFTLFTDITQLGIYGLATADFNNDAIPDLAITSQVTNSVNTWLGDGTGDFNFAGNFSTPGIAEKIATGDINNDGFVDLALAVPVGGSFIAIRLGDGTGNFSGTTNIATGTVPFHVRLADFNEDGNLDVVYSNYTAAPARISFGNGSSGFAAPVSLTTFGNAYAIANADFNGDAHQDLVISRTGAITDVISTLLGTGAGTFNLAQSQNSNFYCTFLEVGDFNEDNQFDFAALSIIYGFDLQISLGAVNDIQLAGNTLPITNGDTSPTSADGTQLSSVCLGSSSIIQQFTIQNTGNTDLILPVGSFAFTGANAANFSTSGIVLPKTIAANSSTTFNVVFNPLTVGSNNATIQITSDDCDESVYAFALNALVTPPTQYYTDTDGDGFGSSLDAGISSCSPVGGYVVNNGDCNDDNASIFPGSTEICDGIDNDCDVAIDEGLVTINYYTDADNDGYGAGLLGAFCAAPIGAVALSGDCNDSNSAIRPGAIEICNTVDDDCDTQIDEGLPIAAYYSDVDGDGYGQTLIGSFCSPPPNASLLSGDCNDSNNLINPSRIEICNTLDDDCDTQIDEGLVTTAYYFDGDGDGYGANLLGSFCSPPANGVVNSGDCNDNNASVNPAVAELCNLIDDDCDGLLNEGCVTNAPANDNPDNSIFVSYSSNLNFPNCYPLGGSLQSASTSTPSPFAGPDVWYTFIANSTAASITLSSTGMDDALALYSLSGNVYTLIDSENIATGNADFERMNVTGLTIGTTYYLCVASANGAATGNFSLCIQHLMQSGCATVQPVGGFSLCQTFKSIFRGTIGQGVSYSFYFNAIANATGTSSITGTNGLITLSNPLLGLRYGGVYNVQVDVQYAVQNSLNQPEPIVVAGSNNSINCSSVTIMSVPLMEVKAAQRCPAALVRNNFLIATSVPGYTTPCGAINYTFEFTSVSSCSGGFVTGLPFEVNTSSSTPYLPLYAAFPGALPNSGYWKVRVKANFSYGPGDYGSAPSWVILVNGTATNFALQNQNETEETHKKSEIITTSAVYPNPSDGILLHINVTDLVGDKVDFILTDATGKLIMTQIFSVDKNLQKTITFLQELKPGIYFIRLKDDGEMMMHKIVVQ